LKGDGVKILFVYKHNRSFVDTDLEILKKHYDVTPFFFKLSKILQLRKEIKRNDIIIVWFASMHAYITSRFTKKPVIVIVGGYDASDIKGYGMFSNFFKKQIVSYIYRKAKWILPVDESLSNVIKKYLPRVSNKIQTIPTGYDYNYFKPKDKKKKQVLTVCYVDQTNWWRKGLKTLVEVAKLMPNVKFVIAGKISEDIKLEVDKIQSKYPNIIFTGWVSDEELLRQYQESKVFALLSKYEGLPNVLCEAMLCGCIPVTTGVCGIPNAQGDLGYYVDYGKTLITKQAIQDALDKQEDINKIRNKIKEKYTIEKRENSLRNILDD
jgi:glycosyltransferase involved in cell wall biosynthesis